MAYNNQKGPQHTGDIQYEADPTDTQIDFDTDLVSLKTNGVRRLTVSGSFITASVSISSSAAVSASYFYGNGSKLTGLSSAAIATYGNPGQYRVVIGSSATDLVNGASNLIFDTSTNRLEVTGDISASLGISGSGLITPQTVINNTHVSSSLNISGAAFYGDGSKLTGLPSAAITSYTNASNNRIVTSVDANTVNSEANLTFDGSLLTVTGDISAQQISSSIGMHVTGSNPKLSIGDAGDASPSSGMLFIRPSDTSNRVLALMQAKESEGNRICFGVTGSGQVLAGGAHLGGVFNVSGSAIEKLISAKSDSHDPAFYVSGSGDVYLTGSAIIKSAEPIIQFTSSVSVANTANIGLNSSHNILIQNESLNRHIVFKANDSGVIKEGLRLDGAVPEVVVNQQGDTGGTLVDFRVESDNKTHMLYVSGAGDAVGIDISVPKTALDVHHNPTTLNNDTGGGEAVKFGTGTTVAGKTYYLHSSSVWNEVSIATAESGGLGMLAIALGTNPANDGMLIRGFFDVHTYLTGAFSPGATLYITGSGKLTTTRPSAAGESLRIAGTCTTTANVVYFNPSPDYLIIS